MRESAEQGLSVDDLVLVIINNHFNPADKISPARIVQIVITEVKCFSSFSESGTEFTLKEASSYYESIEDSALSAKTDSKISMMSKDGRFKMVKRVVGRKSIGDSA